MTTKEIVKYLRQVPNITLWGYVIHMTLKKNPTKETVDHLVGELKSQARDNARGMRDILSGPIYDKIIKS